MRSTNLLKFDATDVRASAECIERIVATNPNLIELALGAHHLNARVAAAIEKLPNLIHLSIRGSPEIYSITPCFELSWPKQSPEFEQLSFSRVDLSRLNDTVQTELARLGDRVEFSYGRIGATYFLTALERKNQQPNFNVEIAVAELAMALEQLQLSTLAEQLRDLDRRSNQSKSRKRSATTSFVQYESEYEAFRFNLFKALQEIAMPMEPDDSTEFASRLQQISICSSIKPDDRFYLHGCGMRYISPMEEKIEQRIVAASK